jgi:hypothetical protein
LLLGYEMYRLLTSERVSAKPKRAMRKAAAVTCEVIDVEAEDSGREMIKGQSSFYLNCNLHAILHAGFVTETMNCSLLIVFTSA